ncbi:putative sodium-dependent transporter YocS [Jeotgalicoccus coquinae]|uniref:BASS family bile acid:Na+ symporter n=1 Tax=Jeotgalicoccus coquinae TaxID=709509 RepID=A0A6V7RK95_9STAP|nr:bile acid:sodium symporter family protein [Jeotgalicoccus coquinae]MBB6422488.1 BASS family bile acid:Na+ symporter [Jeotgalicoccus coquinae]GGE15482.1 putative sodium-dependent transporter YocS [Jeotgalicoccus coquinae]CAD2078427.1 Sodium Bile acid symporter family protein [Jeotgalicoccus coquinae]
MRALIKLSTFIGNTFAVWVILFAALAFALPGGFTWISPYINLLLGIIMFGMGLTLKFNDFKQVVKAPKEVITLVVAQYTIMPLLAVGLVFLFQLPPEIAIGVILVGCSPGGTSSNVMTFLAKGNMALSVTATSVTTLLAPIVTPALTLLLASAWLPVSFSAMFISIIQIVLIPIALGVGVQYLLGSKVEQAVGILPLISVLGIIGVITAVVSNNVENILTSGLLIFAVVILHNLLGYLTGFLLGKVLRFDLKNTKTLSIEVGMQNSGLAATLAATHFSPIAAVPGALFSVWHNISGSLAANWMSKIGTDKKLTEEDIETVKQHKEVKHSEV